jgi:hypothetical protein
MCRAAGIILLSLFAAGCSGGSLSETAGSAQASASVSDWGDRIGEFFSTGGSRRPQQQPGEPPPPDEIECPSITVREGAATLSLHAGRDPSPMSLRYQGTIGRTARECRVVGNMVHMKIGVEGRVILGPAGGPGTLDVPLRLAIVREGPQPQTILTKTYRVPVTIGEGATNVPFVQIDDSIAFPLPSVTDLQRYVIYVGYDPEASKKPAPRQRRPAQRRQS